MTEKPTTAQELEELFGKVDWEQLIRDEVLKEGAEEIQRQYDKHLMTTLYGSSFADMVMIYPDSFKLLEKVFYKKIKRRIFYEVIWWGAESRHTKCFYSVKKMRKFVNELHRWYNEYIEIEKTFCYRDFTPRHKWYYISFEPNQFVCVEKW
jgi:hypothetical protein